MTASHMQLQKPTLIKPIGLPSRTSSRAFHSNSYSISIHTPPQAVPVDIITVMKAVKRSPNPKRCLFGKAEPGEYNATFQKEAQLQRQHMIKRYGFDVQTETLVDPPKADEQTNGNNTNNLTTDTHHIVVPPTPASSSSTSSDSEANSESPNCETNEEQLLRDSSLNNNDNILNNNNNYDLNNGECLASTTNSNNKITSANNCDEARGNNTNNIKHNLNNNNHIHNLNNYKNTNSICNNNNNINIENNNNKNECDLFLSCNGNTNLLIRECTNAISSSSSYTSATGLPSSPMKSTKKSISERKQPYVKQSKMTEFKYPVKKTFTINANEKPKPQKATLDYYITIRKDDKSN